MAVRFKVADFTVSGEWDETSRLLLLNDLGGVVTLDVRMMGWKFTAQAVMETGLNNIIGLRVKSITGLPDFLVPWVLKLILRFNRNVFRAEVLQLRKDVILVDPNQLFPGNLKARVLVQPNTEEDSVSINVVPKLRDKILNWAKDHGGELAKEIMDLILIVPDLVLLLIRLIKDQRVPAELKVKIALAVAYVVSPVDLIPEALGSILGFVDDTLVMAVLIAGLIEQIPDQVIYDNWTGRSDIVNLIITGKDLLSKLLPANVSAKIISLFSIAKNEAAAEDEQCELP